MKLVNAAAPLAAILALAACADLAGQKEPVAETIQATHAQRLAPTNSMVGQACLGYHPTNSLRYNGDATYMVDVTIFEVVDGKLAAFDKIAGTANTGLTQVVRTDFGTGEDAGTCGGTGLKTTITTDGSTHWLEYDLEVSFQGDGELYRIRGNLPVAEGHGHGKAAFEIGERKFLAEVKAAPGPDWYVGRAPKGSSLLKSSKLPHETGILYSDRIGSRK